ncbi:MAG: GNAT family N-acetyltransferase [Chloroflexota bacterium]
MRIVALDCQDQALVMKVAQLVYEGFRESFPGAWPDLEAALEEVRESCGPERLSRVALDDGTPLGWIGGICQYDGHVWELHPLVVSPERRAQGIGRALVADLEEQVRQRGALTLWAGSDDSEGQTSLTGVDLYPDPWPHVAAIRNLRRHPYEFYQKLGFVIVGVMPDANGRGRPDIYLAKRIGE